MINFDSLLELEKTKCSIDHIHSILDNYNEALESIANISYNIRVAQKANHESFAEITRLERQHSALMDSYERLPKYKVAEKAKIASELRNIKKLIAAEGVKVADNRFNISKWTEELSAAKRTVEELKFEDIARLLDSQASILKGLAQEFKSTQKEVIEME